MATASILPPPRAVFFDQNGNLLAGGIVNAYIPGGTTAKQTFQDAAETIPNTSPIILDSNGSALIYGSGGYTFAVTDFLGNAIPEYSGVTQAPGFVSDALLPVVGAATLSAAETALGITPAMQPVVGAATLLAARNLLGSYFITPFGFGGIGDGVADDTTAIQTAMNSLVHGGTLYLPSGYSWKAGSLTIPVGVTLLGPHVAPGGPGTSALPYSVLSSLRLTVGATITMAGSCALSGLVIAPFGMTFPQTTTASFAGTAITATGDDVVVEKCLVLGFAQAFISANVGRVRIRDCNMDNLAGISITNSNDTCHLDDIHMWPFATIQGVGSLPVNLQRSGSGIAMLACNDNTKMVSCFVYGYATGYYISDSIGVQCIGCGADNTALGFGNGFSVVNSCTDTVLLGCSATGQSVGFNITNNLVPNLHTRLVNCDAWVNALHGILIDASALSDVTIIGGTVRDCANGITVASATPRVDIIGVRFERIAGPTAVNLVILSSNVRVDPSCNFGANGSGTTGTAIGTNSQLVSIASATAIALPPTLGPLATVTGTATINLLNGGWAGRQVTLIFSGTLTVASVFPGTASQMRLNGGVNFASVAGSTLTLAHNGAQWFETGRSA